MGAELFTVERPGGAPGVISTMACPPGDAALAGELALLRLTGVDVVLSLLMPEEELLLGVAEEERLAEESGLVFLRLPAPDMSVPDRAAGAAMAAALAGRLRAGEHVVVHCRAGIGRSSVAAALTLCALGLTPDEAVAAISRARGFTVPETPDQRAFVDAVAALL
ncbi:MAG: hypothetical protein KDB63_16430 [Nocardioidaceae bacterium]|nr:hypothetical protein [Nocardioidaceae bacterium]